MNKYAALRPGENADESSLDDDNLKKFMEDTFSSGDIDGDLIDFLKVIFAVHISLGNN